MKREFTEIKIGELGSIDISMPKIVLGQGGPRVLIVSGINGDESSGLFVVNHLLESINLKQGTLTILPLANVLGHALGLKQSPVEGLFPGLQEGGASGLTGRLAHSLFKEAMRHDVVIDFHCLTNFTPITCVHLDHGSQERIDRTLGIIKSFSPELVWKASSDEEAEGMRFSGSLLEELAKHDKPSFAVQMPIHIRVSEGEIYRVTRGILNILNDLEMLDSSAPAHHKEVAVFRARHFYSPFSGIFISGKRLLDEVRHGEKVGEITAIKDFSKRDILSPFDGIITNLACRKFINAGDKVFIVGEVEGKL